MAITVKFYTISKAANSTALPAGDPLAEYECRLLDATSALRPAILLNVGSQANPTAYNYCEIPSFSRYYWVTDWTVNRGQWVASLTVDPLASWKEEIGETFQYVTRSATDFNGALQDSMYPASSENNVVISYPEDQKNPFTNKLSEGEYVVGVVGRGAGSGSCMGAVNYYVMTPAQFLTFGQQLYGNTDIYSLDPSDVNTFKTQFNPLQYITFCQWFPMVLPKGAARTSVDFGWWSIPVSCFDVQTNPIYEITKFFAIPTHPQEARGIYLNQSPYTRYTLQFGPFGELPLDPSLIDFEATTGLLSVILQVDCITGAGRIRVSSGSATVAMARAKVGVDVSLAQIAINARDTLAKTVETVGGALLSGGISLITGGASAINNIWDSLVPQMRTSGNNGSLTEYQNIVVLHAQFFRIAAEDRERLGRPLCACRKISTLSGFVQTVDTELPIPATSGEIDMIKSYMEGGFHYD